MRRLSRSQLARGLLFAYVLLIACPIRYWPQTDDIDCTWVFALNWAAAHGLAFGRDVIWTTGPLGYLTFPQDIGQNLAHALWFQLALWVVLALVFADLFFRSGIRLANLAFFCVFFGLSSPWFWFNRVGVENLLLGAAIILLLGFRRHGGTLRYLLALVLMGIAPMIKLTAAAIAAGALAGFVVERIVELRWKVWRQAVLAVLLPTAVAAAICYVTLPSADALRRFTRASLEIASGYSAALSRPGKGVTETAAVEIALLVVVMLIALSREKARDALALALVAILPMGFCLKHGFTREDSHVLNFFCFATFVLALGSLLLPLRRGRMAELAVILLATILLWQDHVAALDPSLYLQDALGARVFPNLWHLVRGDAHDWLQRTSAANLAADRLEPEIRALVRDQPVASLSMIYNSSLIDHLNLRLYPVVQRYSAYTPYLDRLNADWVREQGPRFLLFDGWAIDDREPWAETPAMWAEVYRWYDTRLAGSENLLLERRERPRFSRLECMRRLQAPPAGTLQFPDSPDAVFWSRQCPLTASGRIREMLFGVPEVKVVVGEAADGENEFRLVPAVLGSPAMGTWLPLDLRQMASVFAAGGTPAFRVRQLIFGGPGASFYGAVCDIALWRPAH